MRSGERTVKVLVGSAVALICLMLATSYLLATRNQHPRELLGEWCTDFSRQTGIVTTFRPDGTVRLERWTVPIEGVPPPQKGALVKNWHWYTRGNLLYIVGDGETHEPSRWSLSNNGRVLTGERGHERMVQYRRADLRWVSPYMPPPQP